MDEFLAFEEIERQLVSLASPGIRPGLARLSRLLQGLDHPERRFPSVLLVGTNGKGSTAATLSSCLREAGYQVALYTSPHLESLGERLLLNGDPLPSSSWRTSLERIETLLREDRRLASDRPSYFEILTALAFHRIAEIAPDLAVVEAGMGGRLDATNVLGDVRATVCTPLGLDHQEYLGGTLEAIAAEKFAVLRPGVPALYAGGGTGLNERFRKQAARVGALPWIHETACRLDLLDLTLQGVRFHRECDGRPPLRHLEFPLPGLHQPTNASLALGALEHLSVSFPRLGGEALRKGLRSTRWPGRMEWFPRGEGGLLLDGAHNPHGVEALARSLEAMKTRRPSWGLVFAAMGDKEIAPSLRRLAPLFETLWCTTVPRCPRAMAADALARVARDSGWADRVEVEPDPAEAVSQALSRFPSVTACGSLFLVGILRGHRANFLGAAS